MNSTPATRLPPDPDDLPLQTASALMKLGLSAPRRPVDDLIERLDRDDGGTWLHDALAGVVSADRRSVTSLLADGTATVEQLTAVKERCKSRLEAADTADDRLAGIAGYFIAIACGLRHHGRLIGGRARAELDPILLDLAAVAPSPFSALLSEATLVPSET